MDNSSPAVPLGSLNRFGQNMESNPLSEVPLYFCGFLSLKRLRQGKGYGEACTVSSQSRCK